MVKTKGNAKTVKHWKCTKCKRELQTKYQVSISRHKQTCGSKSLCCYHCNKMFKRLDNLKRHVVNCDGHSKLAKMFISKLVCKKTQTTGT